MEEKGNGFERPKTIDVHYRMKHIASKAPSNPYISKIISQTLSLSL